MGFWAGKIKFLFLITGFLMACGKKQPSTPKGVLKPEKFADVLVDIRLAEGSYRVLSQNGLVSGNYIDSCYRAIYQFHKIESWQMDSTMSFYSRHPDYFHKILDMTDDKLTDISLSGK